MAGRGLLVTLKPETPGAEGDRRAASDLKVAGGVDEQVGGALNPGGARWRSGYTSRPRRIWYRK